MAQHDNRRPDTAGIADRDAPGFRGGSDRPGRMDDPGAKARETLDDAKQQASAVAHDAKEQGKAALQRQKDSAAGQLDAVADALHSGAERLYDRDQPQAGRFVDYAAEKLERFGRQMRNKDLDSLIGDASEMARRSPAAFFASSVAAGFLLSRFIKSSSQARAHDRAMRRSGSQSRSGIAAPDAPSARSATAPFERQTDIVTPRPVDPTGRSS